MKRRHILLSICSLLPCMVFAQNNGSLAGRVTLTRALNETPEINSRQIIRQYSLASGRYGDPLQATNDMPVEIIVSLNSKNSQPGSKKETAPRHVVMDQKNERFVPHMLAIERGTEVRFLNSDSIYHNVFSLSQAKSFDLGRYPRGKYRSVLFDKAGLVKVYCDIHTHMSAYVLVLDTPFFMATQQDGRFAFDDIPAGRYELVARYGSWQSTPLEIVIEAGKTARIELTLP